MVYTITYYFTDALVRLIIGVAERLRRAAAVEAAAERREEREELAKPWTWRPSTSPYGYELEFTPAYTGVEPVIPLVEGLNLRLQVPMSRGRPPMRLHFTATEAASPKWFEEIERLAKLLEARSRGEGGSR